MSPLHRRQQRTRAVVLNQLLSSYRGPQQFNCMIISAVHDMRSGPSETNTFYPRSHLCWSSRAQGKGKALHGAGTIPRRPHTGFLCIPALAPSLPSQALGALAGRRHMLQHGTRLAVAFSLVLESDPHMWPVSHSIALVLAASV